MLEPVNIRQLNAADPDFDQVLSALLDRETAQDLAIGNVVRDIVSAVRARGDEALLEYTARFDRLSVPHVSGLILGPDDLAAALAEIPAQGRQALEEACQRVRDYHERQKAAGWSFKDTFGSEFGQRVTPLDRVGIYVPGGKAAYPSSVLMNAVPAHVAGVGEIIMVVPTPDGVRNPWVLAAAAIAGVSRVFTIGGAQAVAALAYGTETIPRVDKIVGPGNAYVAEAKRQVFGQVGIDMIAGPSEILVIADGSSPADWVAMDLFSQAEHDEMAQSILICPDAAYLQAVSQSIHRLLADMPRQAVIRQSLQDRGAMILVRDLQEACKVSNRIAPEHLELSVADPDAILDLIVHAGAIFVGPYSSEALGDYCAGPNHVLPTSGTARFSSPLGVYDFQKRSSLIRVSQAGAQHLGHIAGLLADGEGLPAHAASARYRLNGQGSDA